MNNDHIMKAQQAFNRLVEQDLALASFEDVKSVALAIWYEDFVPAVQLLDSRSACNANYLLDRLMRYNCVSLQQQQKLSQAIDYLSTKFDIAPKQTINASRKLDSSAKKWGLENDLKPLLRKLLPYQTRHYKHI